MSDRTDITPCIARASRAVYITLGGPFLVLGVGFVLLELFKNTASGAWKGALIAFLVVLVWTIWIRGFRLVVDGGILKYRDGFYRWQELPLEDIAKLESRWVAWRFLPGSIKVPRMAVVRKSRPRDPLLVNPKPFSRDGLAAVRGRINRAAQNE